MQAWFLLFRASKLHVGHLNLAWGSCRWQMHVLMARSEAMHSPKEPQRVRRLTSYSMLPGNSCVVLSPQDL